jgi:YtkA-like
LKKKEYRDKKVTLIILSQKDSFMLKIFSSFLLILASFSVFAANPDQHLSFAQGKIHAHISWTVGPVVEKESVMLVEFKTGADHKPLDIKSDLTVALFMPEHGHGSSPTKVEKVTGSSSFKVSKMYFTMPGKWEVRVTIKNEDGTKETQTFTQSI